MHKMEIVKRKSRRVEWKKATAKERRWNWRKEVTYGVEVSTSSNWICRVSDNWTITLGSLLLVTDCWVLGDRSMGTAGVVAVLDDWLAVIQSTASDITFILPCITFACAFCCIAAFRRCQVQITSKLHDELRITNSEDTLANIRNKTSFNTKTSVKTLTNGVRENLEILQISEIVQPCT